MAGATAPAVFFRGSAFGSSLGSPLRGAKGGPTRARCRFLRDRFLLERTSKAQPTKPGPGERTSTRNEAGDWLVVD